MIIFLVLDPGFKESKFLEKLFKKERRDCTWELTHLFFIQNSIKKESF